ncbi:LmeA family phospholipid-binding protein [Streptomyces sp. NPDC051555]|uniref:LmeA family phospholipid-binding protein n=1 Tax=Streptomyces sp. NPDC051555 TaxID=3365657 RepID=UPI0037B08CF6
MKSSRPMLRRPVPVLIAVGLTLTAAGAVTDLTVEHIARQRIEQAAACRLSPAGTVTADLLDPLAGLRSLTGDLGTVRVEARRVRHADTEMDVRADLRDVTTDGATSGGTATASVPYAALQKRLADAAPGMTVGGDGNGLTLTGRAGTGALSLPVTVHAGVTATADSLTVTPTTVTVLGRTMPIDALAGLPGASAFTGELAPRTVPVGELPDGARLTGARADASGLAVSLSLSRTTGTTTGGKCAAA